MSEEKIKTIRVTFTDGTIYSCHMSEYDFCCYEDIPFLYIEEWYADGLCREVSIMFDKVKMFTIE